MWVLLREILTSTSTHSLKKKGSLSRSFVQLFSLTSERERGTNHEKIVPELSFTVHLFVRYCNTLPIRYNESFFIATQSEKRTYVGILWSCVRSVFSKENEVNIRCLHFFCVNWEIFFFCCFFAVRKMTHNNRESIGIIFL